MKYASSRLMLCTGCQHVKHGPRTILLKLLTILLSGSPFRWWTRQQVTAGLIPQQSQLKKSMSHVQLLSRATSVLTVELVGTNQFQMFATVSIKKFPRGILDQVISSRNAATVAGRRAPDSGLKQQAIEESVPYTDVIEAEASSLKRQASITSSDKRQALNNKRQALSLKRQAP